MAAKGKKKIKKVERNHKSSRHVIISSRLCRLNTHPTRLLSELPTAKQPFLIATDYDDTDIVLLAACYYYGTEPSANYCNLAC